MHMHMPMAIAIEMKVNALFLLLIALFCIPSLVSSQACQRSCGKQAIKYPFGTGSGCGDPRFHQYVSCDQDHQTLTLTTHTGRYPITAVDYSTQVIYVSDPSMSTCSSTQRSTGFGLDWQAPFTFHDDTVFTLLDCCVPTSPIFSPNGSTVPLCDKQGASICSFLYSCRAISLLDLPISTCCVYTPVDLGPSFDLDLGKLQCRSYSGFYSFNGQDSNPEDWKYGIALKYKFNVYDDYPKACSDCEKSNGVCGYTGDYNAFVCNCADALHTTRDCSFGPTYSLAFKLPTSNYGTSFMCSVAWFLLLVFF